MVRVVDYDLRRRNVLAAVINRYIKEAHPVSSEDLADEFGLSSATLRNILSELEEEGYLTHPYTSGGRVPTTRGYRYYVDFLISQMQLLEEEKQRIIQEYKKEILHLEDVLDRTSGIISLITHYTGITFFPDWQNKFIYKGISYILEEPEFQNLETMRALLKLLEDKQNLLKIINREFAQKTKVYIGEELECEGIENFSLVICRYHLKNRPSGKIAVLGPVRMEYSHTIPTLEYISEILTEVLQNI